MSSDRVVVVFGASGPAPGDAAYEVGIACGAGLARAGLAVATGGYGGIMEAVSRGAAVEGGHVIGVTVPDVFPGRAGANDWVAEEQPAPTIPLRIARLLEISDAAIALPGSIGTLTELVVAWNIGFVARFTGAAPYPLVTVGPKWRDLIEHLGRLLNTDATIVHCAPDVEAAVSEVARRLGVETVR